MAKDFYPLKSPNQHYRIRSINFSGNHLKVQLKEGGENYCKR